MTRVSCPSCRMRFARETATHITACPVCGGRLARISADGALGLRLFTAEGHVHPLRHALDALTPDSPTDPGRT